MKNIKLIIASLVLFVSISNISLAGEFDTFDYSQITSGYRIIQYKHSGTQSYIIATNATPLSNYTTYYYVDYPYNLESWYWNGSSWIKNTSNYIDTNHKFYYGSGYTMNPSYVINLNYIPPLPSYPAPSVTADDTNNVIIGIDSSMEYSLNSGSSWTTYSSSSPPDLTGNKTILVRKKSDATHLASSNVTLTFTINPLPLYDPPSVTADDLLDVIVGIDSSMEYSFDTGTTWTTYDIGSPLDLTGNKVVVVRKKADSTHQASTGVTLMFTSENTPTTPTTTYIDYTALLQSIETTEKSINKRLLDLYNALWLMSTVGMTIIFYNMIVEHKEVRKK